MLGFMILMAWNGLQKRRCWVGKREEDLTEETSTTALRQWFLPEILLHLLNIQSQDTGQSNTTVYSGFDVWPKSMKCLKVILKQPVSQACCMSEGREHSLVHSHTSLCTLLQCSHPATFQYYNEIPTACYFAKVYVAHTLEGWKARVGSTVVPPLRTSVCKGGKMTAPLKRSQQAWVPLPALAGGHLQ